MNFSIFVDTPLDICLMRRIKRDVNERGRSMDSVMALMWRSLPVWHRRNVLHH
jgi:uridine kinase